MVPMLSHIALQSVLQTFVTKNLSAPIYFYLLFNGIVKEMKENFSLNC